MDHFYHLVDHLLSVMLGLEHMYIYIICIYIVQYLSLCLSVQHLGVPPRRVGHNFHPQIHPAHPTLHQSPWKNPVLNPS